MTENQLIYNQQVQGSIPCAGFPGRIERSEEAPSIIRKAGMRKNNLRDVDERHRQSPKSTYERFSKDVSVSLGSTLDRSDLNQLHPFDLAQVRIPPGKSLCPYHEHSAQWELYVVVDGTGIVRDAAGETEVVAGDAFVFRPKEAHRLTNCGEVDFIYYVVANNVVGNSCHTRTAGNGRLRRRRYQIIHGKAAEYFDGEE